MLPASVAQAVAPLPDSGSGHTVYGASPTVLLRIFEPGVQVAWLAREPVAEVADYLAAAAGWLGSGRACVVAAGDDVPDLGLPERAGRDALLGEIRWLNELYVDLLGCPATAMRIEVLDGAMCPRFHVDRTGIRLVCTWRGPGTEWLDDVRADRSRLGVGSRGLGDEDSGLMLPGARVERIPTFAVGLLKGSLWQGNTGRGAIHRSPAVAPVDCPRVMLALDAIWEA